MTFVKQILIALTACSLWVSSASATIVTTLGGVEYEWLELTTTQGMSRQAVEAEIANPASPLYGYGYASRSLIEELLLSYSSWDGLTGYHGQGLVISGMSSMITDFGVTQTVNGDGVDAPVSTVDGFTVDVDSYTRIRGFYGIDDECGDATQTCLAEVTLFTNANGVATMVDQSENRGWSQGLAFLSPNFINYTTAGSFLVRETAAVVPVPAAVWLFGSGLLALAGFVRRRS